MTIKKHFADFLKIRFNKTDHTCIYGNVGYRNDECKDYRIYSIVVAQFESEEELEKYEEEEDCEINEFMTYANTDYEKNQLVIYADDENSFDELVKIFENYECILYQFIISTEKHEVVYE